MGISNLANRFPFEGKNKRLFESKQVKKERIGRQQVVFHLQSIFTLFPSHSFCRVVVAFRQIAQYTAINKIMNVLHVFDSHS